MSNEIKEGTVVRYEGNNDVYVIDNKTYKLYYSGHRGGFREGTLIKFRVTGCKKYCEIIIDDNDESQLPK